MQSSPHSILAFQQDADARPFQMSKRRGFEHVGTWPADEPILTATFAGMTIMCSESVPPHMIIATDGEKVLGAIDFSAAESANS